MTAHRYKAEFLVWLEDMEYWVWQWRTPDHDWYTDRTPPSDDTVLEYRLVPRLWLEEPGKWDVESRWRDEPSTFRPDEGGQWDHAMNVYRLVPRHKPLYQSRVEIPRAMTEEPRPATDCYFADLGYLIVLYFQWHGDDLQKKLLKAGFLYAHEADAKARLDAIMQTEE